MVFYLGYVPFANGAGVQVGTTAGRLQGQEENLNIYSPLLPCTPAQVLR
jgi:hypothetical protein